MFSEWIETIYTLAISEENLRWAGNFLIDIGETDDFDSSTLMVCSEIDNVRLEKICRRISKVDNSLGKKCYDSLIDQEWPDEGWRQ